MYCRELSVFPPCCRKSDLGAYIFNGFLTNVVLKPSFIAFNASIHECFGIYLNMYAPVTVHYVLLANKCFFSFMEKPRRVFHV